MRKNSLTNSETVLSKSEQTREKIVVNAMQLAAREGFGRLSIGRLATKMNMSKSGLFMHFDRKKT